MQLRTSWLSGHIEYHAQLFVHQNPEAFLLCAALNLFSTQLVFVVGIIPTQLQDLALSLVEHLKPVQMSLDGKLALQHVDHTIQLAARGSAS